MAHVSIPTKTLCPEYRNYTYIQKPLYEQSPHSLIKAKNVFVDMLNVTKKKKKHTEDDFFYKKPQSKHILKNSSVSYFKELFCVLY